MKQTVVFSSLFIIIAIGLNYIFHNIIDVVILLTLLVIIILSILLAVRTKHMYEVIDESKEAIEECNKYFQSRKDTKFWRGTMQSKRTKYGGV